MFLIYTNVSSSSIRTYVPHPYELTFLILTSTFHHQYEHPSSAVRTAFITSTSILSLPYDHPSSAKRTSFITRKNGFRRPYEHHPTAVEHPSAVVRMVFVTCANCLHNQNEHPEILLILKTSKARQFGFLK